MFTQSSAINYARNYIIECLNNNIPIQKAILFGSYAHGNQKENSDIDLALVSDKFSENPILNWKLLSPVEIKFVNIETHPFTFSDFNESNPFIDEIKKTGIEIPI